MEHEVTVVTWGRGEVPEAPVPLVILEPHPSRSPLAGYLSTWPRLVHRTIGRAGIAALMDLLDTGAFDSVLFTHSYLAAVVQHCPVPTVVDFANIEVSRLRSFSHSGSLRRRASAFFEYAKARVWEKRVTTRADLVVAISSQDQQRLSRHTASAMLIRSPVVSVPEVTLSPERGYALYLASLDYAPNQAGADWLIGAVWPLVREELAWAELVIAGRGSAEYLPERAAAGVRVLGEVPEVTPCYRDSAMVLAPVVSGGGQQLKVVEALSHGRVLISTRYSAQSAPPTHRHLVRTADDAEGFAREVVNALEDPEDRWRSESIDLGASGAPVSWSAATQALSAWLRGSPSQRVDV